MLLADANLDRTTDGHGPLALKTLPELYGLDAGGWFSKDYHSEPLALLDEALGLEGNAAGSCPQHLALLRERGLVSELARVVAGRGTQLSLRVAAVSRETCMNARDLGLQPMWLVSRADEEARRFVRDERIAACGLIKHGTSAGTLGPGRLAVRALGARGRRTRGAARGLPPAAQRFQHQRAAARPGDARTGVPDSPRSGPVPAGGARPRGRQRGRAARPGGVVRALEPGGRGAQSLRLRRARPAARGGATRRLRGAGSARGGGPGTRCARPRSVRAERGLVEPRR